MLCILFENRGIDVTDAYIKTIINYQDKKFMWKFISNEPNENESQSEGTEIFYYKTQNKKRTITKKSPKHNILKKSKKITVGYREKPDDDFRLMIVDPPPKLDSEESNILSIYFGILSENQQK